MIFRPALMCLTGLALMMGLAGYSAAEACSQWNADGQYRIYQNNGAIITVNIVQRGQHLTGTATFNGRQGRVGGSLTGDYLKMTVNWVGTPSLGVYEAHINSLGGTDMGETWDQLKPNSGKVRFGFGNLKCVVK